jgi:hypothetical protein
MELGLLFWPQTPGLLSWGPQVPSPAGRANLRSRLLRTPSDQAAVVAVLNGHFLCQICAYRTDNRPRPTSILHATNCGVNAMFGRFTTAAMPVAAALVVGAPGASVVADTRAITETGSASGSRRGCFPLSPSTWHSSSARRHVVVPTAEHCDSEERVTCEQSG